MRAIQLKTKPSRTLLITGVKDIGLRSESIDCGWGVFASGRTSALFQSLGTWPSLMEELKMEQTGLEMIDAQSFKTQFGILSGPTDLRSLITICERFRCHSAKHATIELVTASSKSLTYKRKSIGPKILPCGTPEHAGF